jgi:hypothetical protein
MTTTASSGASPFDLPDTFDIPDRFDRNSPVKYRRHNCAATHRTYNRMARCIWRRACWVSGEGRYATIAQCGPTTVMLHAQLNAAREALALINSSGCGGVCRGAGGHRLIELMM